MRFFTGRLASASISVANRREKLENFLEYMTRLSYRSKSRGHTVLALNSVRQPEVGLLDQVLVSINLLLIKAPFRKFLRVGPNNHLGGHMEQLEVAGHGSQLFTAALHNDLEGGLVDARAILVGRVGGDLLVG